MAMKIRATDKKFGTMSKKAERMAMEKNPCCQILRRDCACNGQKNPPGNFRGILFGLSILKLCCDCAC